MYQNQRLTKSDDFKLVQREGCRYTDDLLTLVTRPNGLNAARFGFSVGKWLGKAVVRNTVKRRLKEVSRLYSVQPGWDLVVIARKQAASADFQKLRHSISSLLQRAEIQVISAKGLH